MKLDERGKQCPLPVIEAKKALEASAPGEIVEVIVDNEIAVQNLRKLADHKGLSSNSMKVSEREFVVAIEAGERTAEGRTGDSRTEEKQTAGDQTAAEEVPGSSESSGIAGVPEEACCQPNSRRRGMVVVLSSNQMGNGDEKLGRLLMKGFVYALTQQDRLPETVLMYNSGAFLSCEGSDNLEDLKELEAQGVEILTCGTCLNHYGLSEKLKVGAVTNMYEIAERMTGASLLVRP